MGGGGGGKGEYVNSVHSEVWSKLRTTLQSSSTQGQNRCVSVVNVLHTSVFQSGQTFMQAVDVEVGKKNTSNNCMILQFISQVEADLHQEDPHQDTKVHHQAKAPLLEDLLHIKEDPHLMEVLLHMEDPHPIRAHHMVDHPMEGHHKDPHRVPLHTKDLHMADPHIKDLPTRDLRLQECKALHLCEDHPLEIEDLPHQDQVV